MAITYNTGSIAFTHVYTATSGGTVFSANLYNTAVFDYFPDAPAVNDAIYFGSNANYFSDVALNVGTAMAGTDIVLVWEYHNAYTNLWTTIDGVQDDTVGLTALGANSYKFGFQWNASHKVTNGATAVWVRCRLASFTTVTEGGANSTTVASGKSGGVSVTGYTDASPCTLTAIYNYLRTNYSYLPITKTSTTYSHFDFRPVKFDLFSRLLTTNESFELGNNKGSIGNQQNQLYSLQMGLRIGTTDFGYFGSTLTIHGTANTYPVTFGGDTLIYGSNVKSPGGAGYPSMNGTWVDCNLDGINFSGGTGTFINCRFVDPGTWILVSFPPTFARNKVVLRGAYFGYFYTSSVTIPNLNYSFLNTSGSYFLYLYQTSNDPTFIFINPDPALPGATTANKIVARDMPGFFAYTKVWFYDASAGTYTDVTASFSSDTADDATISGDVGDMYYFGSAASSHSTCWEVTSNLTENDYVYRFEYYSSIWRDYSPVRDRTNNFTATDFIYFGKTVGTTQSLLTVNGYSAYWSRMTITTKGTGTKAISKLLLSRQTGCGDWNVFEKFTIDLKIISEENLPLEGATISITLGEEVIYSGATDASGLMTQQALTSRRWFFDPINSFSNFAQIGEEVKGTYTLSISKAGYETYEKPMTITKKIDEVIKLKTALKLRKGLEGEMYYAFRAENGSSAKILKV
jgi:hypothetical protein